MAVLGSRPNTAARCSGSGPWARASSSWRSTRSRSRVAAWPRSRCWAKKNVLTGLVVVAEEQLADGLGTGGVDGGQDQDQPVGGGHGDLDRLVDVVLAEGLDDPVGLLADLDAPGRVAEDRALLGAEGEQRPQRDQDVGAA